MKKIFFFSSTSLLLLGCIDRSHINSYLSSNNKDSLIIGTYMIEARDTNFIRQIFENPYDSRITHKRKHYGESVYQARMNVLRRISGKEPPQPIVQEPDSSIVRFYYLRVRESGYLK